VLWGVGDDGEGAVGAEDGVHGAELGELAGWEGAWAATIAGEGGGRVVDESAAFVLEGGEVEIHTVEADKFALEEVFLFGNG
jgi:hypothetical protein